MSNKDYIYKFIKTIEENNQLTAFIINIFNYEGLHDYNYIFRLINGKNEVIMDIYDNVSVNRFNRYIFNFIDNSFTIKKKEENNVFITTISIKNVIKSHNKLLKLAYLFKLDNSDKIEYAKTFLNNEFVIILDKIINHQ